MYHPTRSIMWSHVSLRLTENYQVAAEDGKNEGVVKEAGDHAVKGLSWPEDWQVLPSLLAWFHLPFISSSPLPFSLIPYPSHTLLLLLQVSSVSFRVPSLDVWLKMMEGRWSWPFPHTFPDGLWILLSISATQPPVSFHLLPTDAFKRNICDAYIKVTRRNTRDLLFALASAKTPMLLEHNQVVRWRGQWCILKPS